MLTRLRITGFKNLVDVDVNFGPLTCIAGPNGAGKSNLFDAILFLSALADRPLLEAAMSVRDGSQMASDVRNLFHQAGTKHADEMSFEAEMIIPPTGIDDLGQNAKASSTFLRYALTLHYRGEGESGSRGQLGILREELVHIPKGEAHRYLAFPHSKASWRESVIDGTRRAPHFISTSEMADQPRVIRMHQDTDRAGTPLELLAENLPRTVLSAANASENPTALLARREMQSWRLLQLEPTALRRSDDFNARPQLAADGRHLPAALYYLARRGLGSGSELTDPSARQAQVYAQLANRLSELIRDVSDIKVDRDEKRELLTLIVTDRGGTGLPARALSDGTLRFLALAVLELDPESRGLMCLEEPENGIHPERIPAMLELLQDIATDPFDSVGEDNPLRQVIINTHSPVLVAQVEDHCLLLAEPIASHLRGRASTVVFGCLSDTWRAKSNEPMPVVPKGRLLGYLHPVPRKPGADESESRPGPPARRVVDREDLNLMLPFSEESR